MTNSTYVHSTNVLFQKILSALPGELGAGRIVAGAGVAIKTMIGRIKVIDALREHRAHLLDAFARNVLVELAIVKHDRAGRQAVEFLPDAAGVIADRRLHAQSTRADPGKLPTPAKTHQSDASRVVHDVDGRA